MAKKTILGEQVNYNQKYSKDLLFFIKRESDTLHNISRDMINGVDIWNCYELSWLDTNGKPRCGILQIVYSANSQYIVESKSLKLYLNSFNFFKISDKKSLKKIISEDLMAGLNADQFFIEIYKPDHKYEISRKTNRYKSIDNIRCNVESFNPDIKFLKTFDMPSINEKLYSDLLRTNCPVTGQPDWATIFIKYSADKKIDRISLLKYIVSYRNHNDFHETTADKIFIDLLTVLKPLSLEVICNYTRRGGIDINPVRVYGKEILLKKYYSKQRVLKRISRQ